MDKIELKTAPRNPRFHCDNELHVWRIDLETGGSLRHRASLSKDELERAGAYRSPADGRRYVAARSALRAVLSRYLDVRCEDVRFVYNAYGKPDLDRNFHRDPLHFNMSRSGKIAIIALGKQTSIGVDVEFIDQNFPFVCVADKYFSPSIVRRLRQLPSNSARLMFFDLWTGIEAYGKGTGAGLSASVCLNYLAPRGLTGDPAPEELLRSDDWSVANIFVDQNYAAAVATRGPISRFRYWQCLPGQLPAEKSLPASIV